MEQVAHHLQHQAVTNTEAKAKDLFGRSAYNRFYYAAFLRTRDLLTKFDPDWSKIAHKNLPEVLEGQVLSRLRKGQKEAQRARDFELDSQIARAIKAAYELAQILREGYAARVTADYNPEIGVTFAAGGGFSLNSIKIDTAYNWPERARVYCKWIADVNLQLNA